MVHPGTGKSGIQMQERCKRKQKSYGMMQTNTESYIEEVLLMNFIRLRLMATLITLMNLREIHYIEEQLQE